jgi:hypothetical protein
MVPSSSASPSTGCGITVCCMVFILHTMRAGS